MTTESVLALAPDAASAKAARELVSPATWPLLGASTAALWGECKGSGARPYQTQVDLGGPAIKCSCPSRKFPCKHGLALLLLRAERPERFASSDPPDWVAQWLASRASNAGKKAARPANREEAGAPETRPPPDDARTALKREAQRWQRLEAASGELAFWLSDQLARGLGMLDSRGLETWSTMAARMVDAKAPGLAQRILEARAGVRRGTDWPEQTVGRLGQLQLICDAVARRADLSPALQAELRVVLGWPYDKAEVIAHGERTSDHWTVLGIAIEKRDDRLTERRVWLHGRQSGRRALVLDHVFSGRGFERAWATGRCEQGALAWFPGSAALRAIAVDAAPVDDGSAPTWPATDWPDEWEAIARRVAASPWTPVHPMAIRDGVLIRQGIRNLLVTADQAVPVTLRDSQRWSILAVTGGAPSRWIGEWNGHALTPLAVWPAGPGAPLWRTAAI